MTKTNASQNIPNMQRKGMLQNSFYKPSITLTPKPGKDASKLKLWVNFADEH
jgi:hypothetical protein